MGRSSEDSILIDRIPHPDASTVHQADMGIDHTIITDNDIVLNVGKGVDLHTLSDLSTRSYIGLWTNHSVFA